MTRTEFTKALKPTYRSTNIQGLSAYIPALVLNVSDFEHNGDTIKGFKKVYVRKAWPLVNKSDAIKYAHQWKNEAIDQGCIVED
jgi:uncharacterized membrane protein